MLAHHDRATHRLGAPRRLLGRLGDERGIALPIAMTILFAITSLGVVVATQALTSDSQSRRDNSVKRAVAAADAGYDTAVYRLNKLRPGTNQCVVVNGSGNLVLQAAPSDGWCPAVAEDLGDGASYSYRMTRATNISVNGQNLVQRKIVSTGIIAIPTRADLKRRTLSLVGANTGNPLVGNYALISTDPNHTVELPNSSRINGDLGTNASVRLSGQGTVCGDVLYGRGKSYTKEGSAQYNGASCLLQNYQQQQAPQEVQQPFVLGPVEQGNAQTVNNNGSLPSNLYNATNRTLIMGTGDTLTLSGDVYSFCYVELRGTAQITIAPRLPFAPPLRIYIDSPENCGSVPNRGNFTMEQSAKITNQNADPATLIMFLVGSPNIPTTANYDNSTNAQVAMILYAPYSHCDIKNSSRIRGAVACKRVSIRNSAEISWDPLVGALTMTDVVPLYRQQSWVECKPQPAGTVPDEGCA